MLYPNNINEIINLSIDDILKSDGNEEVSSDSNTNSNGYDKDEIESITKKLDFTKYNKLNDGNIFYLDNNKVYNEFKETFEHRFNKKISIFKLFNSVNNKYSYINSFYKKWYVKYNI